MLGMHVFGSDRILIGPPLKSMIMNRKYAMESICSSMKSVLVSSRTVDHTSRPIALAESHSTYLHLHGEKSHNFLYQRKFNPSKRGIGRLNTPSFGSQRMKQYSGMKHGKLLDHGSKIPVYINLNACFTQMGGLQVSSIWFCVGMGRFDLLILNQVIRARLSLTACNTNSDFMHGYGPEPMNKGLSRKCRVGTSRVRSESITTPQVKRNLH